MADSLVAGSDETATITALFVDEDGDPVPHGTPVMWYAQKGTITGDPVVTTGGQATATLSAQGPAASPGANHIRVSVANNIGTMELPFTKPDGLYITLDDAVLAGNATTNGTVDVLQADGSTVAYPYAAQTTAHISGGPPGATVRIEIVNGTEPLVPDVIALGDTTFSGYAFVEGQSLVETTGAVTVALGCRRDLQGERGRRTGPARAGFPGRGGRAVSRRSGAQGTSPRRRCHRR